MPRSSRVAQAYIQKVKNALKVNGFPSQKSLAIELGLGRDTVSKFFNGKGVDHLNFVEISEKLGLDWQMIVDKGEALEEEASPTAEILPPNNIPAGMGIRDPKQFIGREQALTDLHTLLQERGNVAICAVSGMGGVGKTELALQYARQHLQDYGMGVCWLQAGAEGDDGAVTVGSTLPTQIINFTVEHFSAFQPNIQLMAEGQVRQCWRQWLSNSPATAKMLVIVDNVVDYRPVQPYLPERGPQIQVLVTTRASVQDFAELELKVLLPEAALALLALRIGKTRMDSQLDEAKRLCEWLGYLPLGLELVGRYLALEPGLSLAQILLELEDRGLKHRATRKADGYWEMTAEKGVAAAIELSWERLDVASQRLGCLLSLFAPAPIPWGLIEAAEITRCALAEMAFDQEVLRVAKQKLQQLHLLEPVDDQTYRLHQLIRKFMREKLEDVTNV
jgi:hypothetical protein